MGFMWELMGERLVSLLAMYKFNLLSRVGRETDDRNMPWIFLSKEEKSLPMRYRRIMFLKNS